MKQVDHIEAKNPAIGRSVTSSLELTKMDENQ